MAAYEYTVRSEGTACGAGTNTTLESSTTTTFPGGTTSTTVGRTTTTLAGGTAPISASASGLSVPNLTIFGGVPNGVPLLPTPSVTLAADASNSPQTASVASASAAFGPAVIFSSGAMTVHAEGSLEGGGSATSSTDIQNVNASRTEVLTATRLQSTCTASPRGVRGSTIITGGVVQTSLGDRDVVGDERYATLPANPAPNTVVEGQVESVGDTFRYVFNEQVSNANGSLTVYAAHLELLGPTAVGDVYIGRVNCGAVATETTTTLPAATTSSTTTTSSTSSTTTTTTPAPPTLLLPAGVSAQVCRVLDDLRSSPVVSLVIQPLRLLFGCGP